MTSGRFSPRSAGDGSSDSETALVERLRTLPVGPVPDAGFTADLRSQLVAITARIIAESATASATDVTATRRTSPAGLRTTAPASGVLRALRRPVLAFASAAAVLALMLGVAVWMSHGSLPGDSLYGVKRASEDVQLSVAGDDTAKGYTYLGFATTRATEVAKLLGKPSAIAAGGSGPLATGSVSARTSKLVTDTLNSLDSDSRSGMQLLGRATVAQMSAAPLSKLGPWTVGQRAQLTDIESRVPAGTLKTRVKASLVLLGRIEARAAALRAKIGCPCLSQAVSDDLGPVPCSTCTALTPPGTSSGPGAPGSSATAGNGGTGNGGTGTGGSGPAGAGNSGAGSNGGGNGTANPGTSSAGGGGAGGNGGATATRLPTLPGLPTATPLPSGPVSIGPGGVSISLPGVGVGVGAGGVSTSLPSLSLGGVHLP
jgi:hypothetical protein